MLPMRCVLDLFLRARSKGSTDKSQFNVFEQYTKSKATPPLQNGYGYVVQTLK